MRIAEEFVKCSSPDSVGTFVLIDHFHFSATNPTAHSAIVTATFSQH